MTPSQQGYNIIHGDAQNFDLGDTFDVVIAGELIEHLSNVGGFLDCVHEHLEGDGEFILTTPNPWAFHRFKQAGFGEVFANKEHTCWFDERTLQQVLTRHQFEVTSIEYVKASTTGITSLLYRFGFQMLGGTSLLVRSTPTR
jgi:2-polyprenyl-3-methyl-5-hydroxy-6-metoxy-1,4-benzoquinol methylase